MSLMLAIRYSLEGNHEQAIHHYKKYMPEHPDDRHASLRLAGSLLSAGRFQEADRTIHGLEPLEPEGVLLRSLCRLALSGEDAALRYLWERGWDVDWEFWWSSVSGWVKPFVQGLWDHLRGALRGIHGPPWDFMQWLMRSVGSKGPL